MCTVQDVKSIIDSDVNDLWLLDHQKHFRPSLKKIRCRLVPDGMTIIPARMDGEIWKAAYYNVAVSMGPKEISFTPNYECSNTARSGVLVTDGCLIVFDLAAIIGADVIAK